MSDIENKERLDASRRNAAIVSPRVPLRTLDGGVIYLRPLSIGTVSLLRRVGNDLFTAADDEVEERDDMSLLQSTLEVLYILGGDLEEVRRSCFGSKLDFEMNVQVFVDSLAVDTDFGAVIDGLSAKKEEIDAAYVEPYSPGSDVNDDPKGDGQMCKLDC